MFTMFLKSLVQIYGTIIKQVPHKEFIEAINNKKSKDESVVSEEDIPDLELWRLMDLEQVRSMLTHYRTTKEMIEAIWKLDRETQLQSWVLL